MNHFLFLVCFFSEERCCDVHLQPCDMINADWSHDIDLLIKTQRNTANREAEIKFAAGYIHTMCEGKVRWMLDNLLFKNFDHGSKWSSAFNDDLFDLVNPIRTSETLFRFGGGGSSRRTYTARKTILKIQSVETHQSFPPPGVVGFTIKGDTEKKKSGCW